MLDEQDYPKRHITHLIEKDALEILNKQLPREWIIREITERDYGIDLYVEMVKEDKRVTGELIAIQVKGKEKIEFKNDNTFTFYSIKSSTLNYWLNLPVPVFFVVVCTTSKQSYWCNIRDAYRTNKLMAGENKTFYTKISKDYNLSTNGLILFRLNYLREKRWPAIENAMENSLMLFNSLGPFVLMCKRMDESESCSTTIQYLLIQHYEYYYLLSRYILGKKPKLLPDWYDKHIEENTKAGSTFSYTFRYSLVHEMIFSFIPDYREAIRRVYLMVTSTNSEYYSKRFAYLYLHLKTRPLHFIEADWFARYFYDEYEDETQDIEIKYFNDFTDFDNLTF